MQKDFVERRQNLLPGPVLVVIAGLTALACTLILTVL